MSYISKIHNNVILCICTIADLCRNLGNFSVLSLLDCLHLLLEYEGDCLKVSSLTRQCHAYFLDVVSQHRQLGLRTTSTDVDNIVSIRVGNIVTPACCWLIVQLTLINVLASGICFSTK